MIIIDFVAGLAIGGAIGFVRDCVRDRQGKRVDSPGWRRKP